MKNITCPISSERIPEHTPRIIALFIAFILIAYIISGNLFFPLILAVDFFSRSFLRGKFSLIAFVAKYTGRFFNIKSKLVDKAPKIFAARLGFGFSLVLLGLAFFNYTLAAQLVVILFGTCAFLEFAFSFCVGCIIYSIVNHTLTRFTQPKIC